MNHAKWFVAIMLCCEVGAGLILWGWPNACGVISAVALGIGVPIISSIHFVDM